MIEKCKCWPESQAANGLNLPSLVILYLCLAVFVCGFFVCLFVIHLSYLASIQELDRCLTKRILKLSKFENFFFYMLPA